MMNRIVSVMVMLMLWGCASSAPAPQPTGALEVSRDPRILYLQMNSWSQMSFKGVHLGDRESAVPRHLIRQRNEAGWVILRDGARYRIANHQVVGIGVWDSKLLLELEIHRPEDIERKFGRAEKIEDLGTMQIYYYRDGHIHVIWNTFENRVTTVNIMA